MKIEKIYCVMLIHSGIIVFCHRDPKVANFICDGILNSVVKVIHLNGHEIKYNGHPYVDLEPNQIFMPLDNSEKAVFKYSYFKLTRQGLISNFFDANEEQINLKKYAKLRAEFYCRFVEKFKDQLSTLEEYGTDTFNIIRTELMNCSTSYKFSNVVLEYAEINGIEPFVAENELKMKVVSYDMVKIRNKALFDKYAIELSKIITYEEGEELFKSAITELLRNGAV